MIVNGKAILCKWHLLCAREATKVVKHPKLGNVEMCDECSMLYVKPTIVPVPTVVTDLFAEAA